MRIALLTAVALAASLLTAPTFAEDSENKAKTREKALNLDELLQEVKQGMIVSFTDLGEYPPGGYQELVDAPEEFLAREYGKKKIKVNFYFGENFVCTINFKVAGWESHDDD